MGSEGVLGFCVWGELVLWSAGENAGIFAPLRSDENPTQAAARALAACLGQAVEPAALRLAARLHRVFPADPDREQRLHIFLLPLAGATPPPPPAGWAWQPRPVLPLARPGSDTLFWLPGVLAGEQFRCRLIYHDDNETIKSVDFGRLQGES